MSASDQKYSDKPDHLTRHKRAMVEMESNLALTAEPWHTHVGMSDQEIRARALECASRCHAMRDAVERDVIVTAGVFENYIRGGK